MEFSPLFAYLDPGTLTFLMQCLVAAVVGGALSIRMFWTGLKMRFASLFGFHKQDVVNNGPSDSPAGAGSQLSVFSNEHDRQTALALDSTVSMVPESPTETQPETSPEKRSAAQRETQSGEERRAA